MQVKLYNGESAENLIRRFIKKVKKSGLMEELMERKTFKKPSVLNKEKKMKRKRTLEKLKQDREKSN